MSCSSSHVTAAALISGQSGMGACRHSSSCSGRRKVRESDLRIKRGDRLPEIAERQIGIGQRPARRCAASASRSERGARRNPSCRRRARAMPRRRDRSDSGPIRKLVDHATELRLLRHLAHEVSRGGRVPARCAGYASTGFMREQHLGRIVGDGLRAGREAELEIDRRPIAERRADLRGVVPHDAVGEAHEGVECACRRCRA